MAGNIEDTGVLQTGQSSGEWGAKPAKLCTGETGKVKYCSSPPISRSQVACTGMSPGSRVAAAAENNIFETL